MKSIVCAGLAIAAVAAAACSDNTSPSLASSRLAISMASAYSATPAGFSELTTSYDAAGSGGTFQPGFEAHGGGGRGPGGFGHGDGPGFGLGGLMGGGLGGAFFGDGFGRGDFHVDSSCVFAAGTGQVTCGPATRNGITVTRVSKYTTTAGAAQAKIDSTTNTIVTSATVTGTTTRRDSSTSIVNETSSQTATGLAYNSTTRTVNGKSAGTESTTGKSQQGAYTAKRTVGDTVTGVAIPAATTANTHPYPTAGTVIRSMAATVTITGQAATSSTRREVVSYDGTANAKVVITVDGTVQNCTLPLPHGKLVCQ
jgi:hypothetical protein